MKDRASTYDKPSGERSMGMTVKAFESVSGVSMTEEQGWLFMALLKAVRSQQGALRMDSYEDGAAYFALAGEAAREVRLQPNERRSAFGPIIEEDEYYSPIDAFVKEQAIERRKEDLWAKRRDAR